jgi:hypothetical protein
VVFNEFVDPQPIEGLDRSKRPAERSRGERTRYTLDDFPLSAQPERQEPADFNTEVVADMGLTSLGNPNLSRTFRDRKLGDADNLLDP